MFGVVYAASLWLMTFVGWVAGTVAVYASYSSRPWHVSLLLFTFYLWLLSYCSVSPQFFRRNCYIILIGVIWCNPWRKWVHRLPTLPSWTGNINLTYRYLWSILFNLVYNKVCIYLQNIVFSCKVKYLIWIKLLI